MKSLILVISLLLVGCDFNVYNYELKGYEENCSDKGGVVLINNFFSDALCGNGEVVTWWYRENYYTE